MTIRPLNGITVVEMGSSLAGPFGARLLADFGATVLKIEPPENGDPARQWGDRKLGTTSATFQALNNGKRSIVADFKHPDDVQALQHLIVEHADVLLQNLRPGIADNLGLGPERALQLKPSLIYCNISAFGRVGPLSQMPGYDPLLQAFSGIIDLTGPADGDPARVGVPIIDLGTGLWAALGVLAALHTRAKTGQGCVVDAAMLDTALALQTVSTATVESGSEPPQRSGLRGPLLVPNTGYQTADGILIITIGTDKQFQKLCDVIGRSELAVDQRFATNARRLDNEAELRVELERTFAQQTRAHWSTLLNAADVANAPIQSVQEVLAHEQTTASGIVSTAPDGSFRLIANALKFDGERPGFERPAPELGEATAEMLGTFK